MSSYFCVSATFLVPQYHGRRDGGEPEWPPSPLRLFQSLVNASAQRPSREIERGEASLRWLEELPPPDIVAPRSHLGVPLRTAVPNNDLDLIASAWSKGQEPRKQPSELKTLKSVQTVHLLDNDAVHYLWRIPESFSAEAMKHFTALSLVARSMIALGWGIDMVAGNASTLSQEDVTRLSGDRWTPTEGATSTVPLRVPVSGTLAGLVTRHRAFLGRISRDDRGHECFNPVPPVSEFRTVAYRRTTDTAQRPVAAFSLLKLDGSGFRPFDAARRTTAVAAMLRHAAKCAAENMGRDPDWIARFVLGHGEEKGCEEHVAVGPRRFAYVPLSTIHWRGRDNRRVVGDVRRALVMTFAEGCDAEVTWARRAISGMDFTMQIR